jgi:hypothetical protein
MRFLKAKSRSSKTELGDKEEESCLVELSISEKVIFGYLGWLVLDPSYLVMLGEIKELLIG